MRFAKSGSSGPRHNLPHYTGALPCRRPRCDVLDCWNYVNAAGRPAMSRKVTLTMMALVIGWVWTAVATAQELPPQDLQSGTLFLRTQAGLATAVRTNTA